jgi:hypothetical protein
MFIHQFFKFIRADEHNSNYVRHFLKIDEHNSNYVCRFFKIEEHNLHSSV